VLATWCTSFREPHRVVPDRHAGRVAQQAGEMHLDVEPFDMLAVDNDTLSPLRAIAGKERRRQL
jgi:hypothetical protein